MALKSRFSHDAAQIFRFLHISLTAQAIKDCFFMHLNKKNWNETIFISFLLYLTFIKVWCIGFFSKLKDWHDLFSIPETDTLYM